MTVRIHPHARDPMAERGASEAEVTETILQGTRFAVKFGRVGFRRDFTAQGTWRGRSYQHKRLEVIAVEENGWLAITVVVKYF